MKQNHVAVGLGKRIDGGVKMGKIYPITAAFRVRRTTF